MIGELSARSRRKGARERGTSPRMLSISKKARKGERVSTGVLIWVDDEAAQQLFTRPKKKEKRKKETGVLKEGRTR